MLKQITVKDALYLARLGNIPSDKISEATPEQINALFECPKALEYVAAKLDLLEKSIRLLHAGLKKPN